MSDIAIKVENLSKQYRLGVSGTGTISHDLNRWWHSVRGKEDPYAIVGQVNDRTVKTNEEYVWALKDINFEVKKGEILGIIGRNGAGKSTLLKILSKVTGPSTGKIAINGRISALLEVGTGFHPELTGRENVYLNGAILGMTKKEISRKFDEIVDFSGCEKYIDTPVKRYSSGMIVRLGFAVAAHLEPEILIVDEVLAVGDAEFQKKCLGKMKDVSVNEGRTVLFVSHNMGAIQRICNIGMLLKNGQNTITGPIDTIINNYLTFSDTSQAVYKIAVPENASFIEGYALSLQVEDIDGNQVNEIPVGKLWQIKVRFKLNRKVNHFVIGLGINTSQEVNLRTSWSKEADLEPGDYEVIFKEDNLLFASGVYNLVLGLSTYGRTIQYIENVASIKISDMASSDLDQTILRTSGCGFFVNPMPTQISKILI